MGMSAEEDGIVGGALMLYCTDVFDRGIVLRSLIRRA